MGRCREGTGHPRRVDDALSEKVEDHAEPGRDEDVASHGVGELVWKIRLSRLRARRRDRLSPFH